MFDDKGRARMAELLHVADNSGIIIVNQTMLKMVSDVCGLQQHVAGPALRRRWVADTTQIHNMPLTDMTIHGAMGVPNTHQVRTTSMQACLNGVSIHLWCNTRTIIASR